MNTLIPKSKVADCCQCGDKGVPCRKVGKLNYCIQKCHRNNKIKQYTQKANERNQVRSLNVYQKQEGLVPAGTFELQRWFEARKKQMTGKCKHCGGKTTADTSSYKNSVAHILPKAYFKSVATHPLNWIELCFYGKSCHTNFDHHMLDIMELNCFDEVIEKFIAMYPSIAEEEKRRIPTVLLQYVQNNT